MFFNFLGMETAELLTPNEILQQSLWKIDPHNAPFLTDETGEKRDEMIIGDISHNLSDLGENVSIIIATDTNFQLAQERAVKLGYRPVWAGEFLQILWWYEDNFSNVKGWFYCYAGRHYLDGTSGFAILAELFHSMKQKKRVQLTFDTRIPDKTSISANMDSICFFVKV